MTLLHKIRTVARVAGALLDNPEALPTLSWLVNRQLTNWDLAEPWWNSRAISYLAERLKDGDRVWEWGAGGSTVWLVERAAEVISIEDNAEWARKVQQRCPGAEVRLIGGADSGILRSEPAFSDHGIHFFDEYVTAIDHEPDKSLDVVIADGRCRLDCVRHAAPKLRPGGLLVLDDTDRSFLSAGLPSMPEVKEWKVVKKSGFKRGSSYFTETTFLHKPGT